MSSEPLKTSSTRSSGQMPSDVKLSSIYTRPSFSSSSSICVHLVLLMRVGEYSLCRRFQKLSGQLFACFQNLLNNLLVDAL